MFNESIKPTLVGHITVPWQQASANITFQIVLRVGRVSLFQPELQLYNVGPLCSQKDIKYCWAFATQPFRLISLFSQVRRETIHKTGFHHRSCIHSTPWKYVQFIWSNLPELTNISRTLGNSDRAFFSVTSQTVKLVGITY